MRTQVNKMICTLWGHSFVLTASSQEFVRGGHDSICRRCGKERFRTHSSESFPDLEMSGVRESMVNFKDRGMTTASEYQQ